MANYTLNQELNGIEISFDQKPDAATLDALKANGYRWHRVKKVWYAKQTPARLALAETITEGQTTPAPVKADIINLDNLGENAPRLYGAELAAAIRADLKKRGVSGVTVRTRKVTHETGITVTIKATANEIASIEEYQKRYTFESFSCDAENYHGVFDGQKWIYSATWEKMTEEERRAAYDSHTKYYLTKSPDFNIHHTDRDNYPALTTALYNKVYAAFMIANQWNYNNSDSMSDYFDIGYFLDIDIKNTSEAPRETMTDTERTAYEAEQAQKAAERAAEIERWEKEQEENRKAREEAERREQENRATIAASLIVEDLEEKDHIYITNLAGGIGKECNIDELNETILENPHISDGVITRKIHMTPAAFEAFSNMLLYDFDFLEGKGGTASEDVRLETAPNLYSLTPEQRESVKWYLCDCVGIYVDGVLQLVCDPEGYTYSRYTYKPTNTSRYYSAATVAEEQRKESEEKTAFYFPKPIEEQAEAITEGEQITIYQCDGWMINSVYAGFGTVLSIEPGNYAQHKGLYINLIRGGKGHPVFIRDGKKCLIYKGIKNPLPDSVTKTQIDAHMFKLHNSDELFPRILDYYGKQGEKPILDTIQR